MSSFESDDERNKAEEEYLKRIDDWNIDDLYSVAKDFFQLKLQPKDEVTKYEIASLLFHSLFTPYFEFDEDYILDNGLPVSATVNLTGPYYNLLTSASSARERFAVLLKSAKASSWNNFVEIRKIFPELLPTGKEQTWDYYEYEDQETKKEILIKKNRTYRLVNVLLETEAPLKIFEEIWNLFGKEKPSMGYNVLSMIGSIPYGLEPAEREEIIARKSSYIDRILRFNDDKTVKWLVGLLYEVWYCLHCVFCL
eukprot:TRINITY_DN6898_c0_g1_i2.p1 TRINITY_DN6898_c0_g1~~TRINITY_DN6898_c0_g1_i2.p1  ORF type:complete len:253 (-),score=38.69 TRINITY_DN6898_c0_g1_i2:27-785(-)